MEMTIENVKVMMALMEEMKSMHGLEDEETALYNEMRDWYFTEVNADYKSAKEFLYNNWGEETTEKVLAETTANYSERSINEFLEYCVACGGDWGAMLLSGLKELYPTVWRAIPDKMGKNSWICICSVLDLCGVLS